MMFMEPGRPRRSRIQRSTARAGGKTIRAFKSQVSRRGSRGDIVRHILANADAHAAGIIIPEALAA
jgi:hypothetical protein